MKILYIITGLGVGGAERQLINLSDELSVDNEIMIISLTNNLKLFPKNKNIKISIIDANKSFFGLLKSIYFIKKTTLDFKPDIVHAHMFHAIIITRIARIFSKIPKLISTSHCINEMRKYSMFFYRLTDHLTDLSSNVSKMAYDEYIKKSAWPKFKSIVVENGVDVDYFSFSENARCRIRSSLKINDDTKVILAIGRLVEEKNYPLLINSFAQLCKNNENVKLLIIGSGPQMHQLLNLSHKLHVFNNLIFLGEQFNVVEWISACDIFILTSNFEGFGLVIAEAMACERIVVATDCGSIKNIVNQAGFIVDKDDINTLVNKLNEALVLEQNICIEIGKKAREQIIKNYSLKSVADKWRKIYFNLNKQQVNV